MSGQNSVGDMAFSYWLDASQFYDAFKIIQEKSRCDEDFMPVRYYLLCHSLELALKSYLIFHGYTVACLKNDFGHNLLKLFREAEKNNLRSIAHYNILAGSHVDMLDNTYGVSVKWFEYPRVFECTLPNYVDVSSLLEVILEAIGKNCFRKEIEEWKA
ncbi:MAG: hypothetical protein AB7D07_15940 [Desulfovibrionaceae bacterium]